MQHDNGFLRRHKLLGHDGRQCRAPVPNADLNSFPGTPYDGHTLTAQIEQATTLLQDIGVKPTTAIVDLGYRGVDQEVAPVQVIHRGKSKTMTDVQRRWLKRRQAIEPAIGHTKHDNSMHGCWLKGTEGDSLHAVLCAAGFNIRWLLRAIVRLGLATRTSPAAP